MSFISFSGLRGGHILKCFFSLTMFGVEVEWKIVDSHIIVNILT